MKTHYHNSEEHHKNLISARTKALQKVECRHCSNYYTLGNIKKHEISCRSNPENFIECAACGKPFSPKYKGTKTCSYACSNKHFRSGEDNGNWKLSSYRSTCFHFHKKECVVCGENKIVTVHHLDEDHHNNDPSNLIPMCPTHHQYWHSRYKSDVYDQVMKYIQDWKEENRSA